MVLEADNAPSRFGSKAFSVLRMCAQGYCVTLQWMAVLAGVVAAIDVLAMGAIALSGAEAISIPEQVRADLGVDFPELPPEALVVTSVGILAASIVTFFVARAGARKCRV